MAGRRECQSVSTKPSQEHTDPLSPDQVKKAVDAIQYLSSIGRLSTNATTTATGCSRGDGACVFVRVGVVMDEYGLFYL